jgi:hypothetical protein
MSRRVPGWNLVMRPRVSLLARYLGVLSVFIDRLYRSDIFPNDSSGSRTDVLAGRERRLL